MSSPPPGSFFLRHPGGLGGRCIAAAQAFVRGGSYWTHAGLVLDRHEVIEAQPGGAKIRPLDSILDGRPTLISDEPVRRQVTQFGSGLSYPLQVDHYEALARACVVERARDLEGTPYSFLDYLALGVAEWAHVHRGRVATAVADALRGYVESSGHLICSALVDRAYSNAGIHLFDDGRLPGDVTPQDLAEYADGGRS